MFAVIETGGKQYLVSEGQKLKIEKIESPKDDKILFDKVLLLSEGGKVEIGQPYVKNAKIEAKLLSQGRNKKIIVFKYKPKKRYRVKKGHRQPFTEIEIVKIKAA